MTELPVPELPQAQGLRWSVELGHPGRMPLAAVDADRSLRTASVAKILLLAEVARQITSGDLDPTELLHRATRESADWVGDSGLWHLLAVESLPVSDVAALVGAVSDNLATNALIQRVGLPAVTGLTGQLGLNDTALHDLVRDHRGPEHGPTLSTGSAAELRRVIDRSARGEAVSPDADSMLLHWLSGNVDQSMVGAAFVDRLGLDPIAHHWAMPGHLRLANKTGTDSGIRADIGVAHLGERSVSWAAIANWPDEGRPEDDALAAAAMTGMRRIGESAVALLSA